MWSFTFYVHRQKGGELWDELVNKVPNIHKYMERERGINAIGKSVY